MSGWTLDKERCAFSLQYNKLFLSSSFSCEFAITMSTPNHSKSSNEAISPFTIPPVFDPVYYTTPDPHSVLVHSISSSSEDDGFQAILCLHSRVNLPSHLGLPNLSNYNERAFLQVAPINQPFMLQTQAARAHSMQITVTEYLILLQFIENEWGRLQSKLESQLITMQEGTDPIYLSGYLKFYNHGTSHFRVSLSSRLVFVASVELRDAKRQVKAWLERRPLSDQNDYQEMALPMNSLVLLTKDKPGMQALVEQMGAYKNRSRKRVKSVVS